MECTAAILNNGLIDVAFSILHTTLIEVTFSILQIPIANENEEVFPQSTNSQPSWSDLHPELAAKSKVGGHVEDLPIVKAYREDLAKRERVEKR